MDYGIENTTHDKSYFDEIDRDFEKGIWMGNRISEIYQDIVAGNHNLYSVSDCVEVQAYNSDEEFKNRFTEALDLSLINLPQFLLAAIRDAVLRQAKMLAEGELAAMENEDDD